MELHSYREEKLTDGLWGYDIRGEKCTPFMTVLQHYVCRHCGMTVYFPENIYPIRSGCSGKPAWKAPLPPRKPPSRYEDKKDYPKRKGGLDASKPKTNPKKEVGRSNQRNPSDRKS